MITAATIKALSKNNYVRKATQERKYWFDFSKNKLDTYLANQNHFNLIIYSGLEDPRNYYIFPYSLVEDAFQEEFMTKDKMNRKRWVGTIEQHNLKISNYPRPIDISRYYSVEIPGIPQQPMISVQPQIVKTWDEVIDNLRQFSLMSTDRTSFTLNSFSFFSNWYYFPLDDTFAPGKFIGYKNTTVENYIGNGDGAEAKRALLKFFDKLDNNSSQYKELKEKLIKFGQAFGKEINSQTFHGSAGIFIPKENFAKIHSQYSQLIFKSAVEDIDGLNDENYTGFEGGEKKERMTSYYERDPKLRAMAIKIHGTKCKVCKFDFIENYGPHGSNYIEVHHLKALHTLVELSEIDPEHDMTVLCSNCHRMIHRRKYFPLSIENLRSLWENFGGKN